MLNKLMPNFGLLSINTTINKSKRKVNYVIHEHPNGRFHYEVQKPVGNGQWVATEVHDNIKGSKIPDEAWGEHKPDRFVQSTKQRKSTSGAF